MDDEKKKTTATDAAAAAAEPGRKPLKKRLQDLMEEYGQIAIVTWLVIFGLTLGGFVVAIKMGYQPENAAQQTGILAMAYGATQLTKPIRIFATLAVTPVIARFIRRSPSP